MDARINPAVADDRVAAIAGHEQDPKAVAKPDRFIGEFASVHVSGHHDVGQQKIESPCIFEDRQSGLCAGRLGDAVAKLAQYFRRVSANRVIVLDDENAFAADRSRERLPVAFLECPPPRLIGAADRS